MQATLDAAPPENVTEVRMFLGMSTYYDKSGKGYAIYMQPRFKLLDNWGQDYEDASEHLKLVLTKAPVLRRLDSSLTYVLYTDWSSPAIGAVLEQTDQDGSTLCQMAESARRCRAQTCSYPRTVLCSDALGATLSALPLWSAFHPCNGSLGSRVVDHFSSERYAGTLRFR